MDRQQLRARARQLARRARRQNVKTSVHPPWVVIRYHQHKGYLIHKGYDTRAAATRAAEQYTNSAVEDCRYDPSAPYKAASAYAVENGDASNQGIPVIRKSYGERVLFFCGSESERKKILETDSDARIVKTNGDGLTEGA